MWWNQTERSHNWTPHILQLLINEPSYIPSDDPLFFVRIASGPYHSYQLNHLDLIIGYWRHKRAILPYWDESEQFCIPRVFWNQSKYIVCKSVKYIEHIANTIDTIKPCVLCLIEYDMWIINFQTYAISCFFAYFYFVWLTKGPFAARVIKESSKKVPSPKPQSLRADFGTMTQFYMEQFSKSISVNLLYVQSKYCPSLKWMIYIVWVNANSNFCIENKHSLYCAHNSMYILDYVAYIACSTPIW